MVQKTVKKRAVSCSGPKKPLSSFEKNTAYDQSCSTENVNKCNVNNEKVYTTRFVSNSNVSQSKIQSLLAMSKSKALEVYRKFCTSSVRTRIACSSFAQDGRQCNTPVSKLRSLCDGCLFSSVVAGRAPDKANCTRSVTGSDKADDDKERGHIISPIHSTSIEKHADDCHKVVGGAEYADRKFKIFDINGLEDKYLNSILNRSCHFTSTPDCDLESYKNWKAQSDFDFGFIPMGEFRFSESEEIHEMLHYCPIKAHAMVKQYKKPNFLGARLKVDSQLNLGACKFHLSDYWDKQLIDLLYFGFPLDFNRTFPLK